MIWTMQLTLLPSCNNSKCSRGEPENTWFVLGLPLRWFTLSLMAFCSATFFSRSSAFRLALSFSFFIACIFFLIASIVLADILLDFFLNSTAEKEKNKDVGGKNERIDRRYGNRTALPRNCNRSRRERTVDWKTRRPPSCRKGGREELGERALVGQAWYVLVVGHRECGSTDGLLFVGTRDWRSGSERVWLPLAERVWLW